MNKGFTLIELLVVVLIIGILASVALPQYTKAVRKARLSEMQGILSSLEKATIEWKLANDTPSGSAYIDLADQLSVDFGWPAIETNTGYFVTPHCNTQKKLCILAGANNGEIDIHVFSYDIGGDPGNDDYSIRVNFLPNGIKKHYYNVCTDKVDLSRYGLESFGFEYDGC